ncbi:MAG: cobalt-precorrin-6A reductase [Halocynthiibacter sp.]
MQKTLILGGTSEASKLARVMSVNGKNAIFSYAGRTNKPVSQPLPTRIGGFGGAAGLARYIRDHHITHLVDATHPFAAQMSQNAVTAANETGVDFAVLERPAWSARAEDKWLEVADYAAAVAALGAGQERVFLAIGKQNINAFQCAPQHQYLLRLVDDPDEEINLPNFCVIKARGPFDVAGDLALLRDHRITKIVAKNAGGTGAEAKLTAARALGIEVILIQRPSLGPRPIFHSPEAVLNWLDRN